MIVVDCKNTILDSQNPPSKKVLKDQIEVKKIDIVLVPVVAFSRDGNRLDMVAVFMINGLVKTLAL